MTNRIPDRFATGVFTVSLDFELLWGTIDRANQAHFRKLCSVERTRVIPRLLELFAEFEVPATWCTVGHLFLAPAVAARRRAALKIPSRAADPRLPREPIDDPLLLSRDLVDRIRQCATVQEIGGHGFTHLPFTDSMCTAEAAATEIEELERSARSLRLTLRSFAFPRNRIAHVDLLARHGYSIFRCQDASWHHQANTRGWKHRLGHAWDIVTAATPPTVMPSWHEAGVWQIPGSMLFTPARGIRGAVPVALRVRRAKKGLDAAAADGRVFHLWFHPTDLAARSDDMLDGLRQVLAYARTLRDAGKLEFRGMHAIARRLPALVAQEALLAR